MSTLITLDDKAAELLAGGYGYTANSFNVTKNYTKTFNTTTNTTNTAWANQGNSSTNVALIGLIGNNQGNSQSVVQGVNLS